jgi:CHAT domain-containing protein/HEPN domain-containing protein
MRTSPTYPLPQKSSVVKRIATFWRQRIPLFTWLLLLSIGIPSGVLAQETSPTVPSSWDQDSLAIDGLLQHCNRIFRTSRNPDSLLHYLSEVERREDLLCQIPRLKFYYLLRRVSHATLSGKSEEIYQIYQPAIEDFNASEEYYYTFWMAFYFSWHAYQITESEEALQDVMTFGKIGLAAFDHLSEQEQEDKGMKPSREVLQNVVESASLWLTLPPEDRNQLRDLVHLAGQLTGQGIRLHNAEGRVQEARVLYETAQSHYDTILTVIKPPAIWNNYFTLRHYLHMSLSVAEGNGEIPRSAGRREAELKKTLAEAKANLARGNRWIEQATCDLADYYLGASPIKALDILRADSISFSLMSCNQILANAHVVMGDYARAKEIYDNLIKTSTSEYTRALYFQDYAFFLLGVREYEAAQYYAEQALEKLPKVIRPTHPRLAFAKEALATVYVHQGKYQEAISLITEAKNIMIPLAGDRAEELISMNKIHIESLLGLGQVAGTKELLSHAYLCLPNSSFLYYHISMKILAARVTMAHENYEAALDTIEQGISLLGIDPTEESESPYKRYLLELLHWRAKIQKSAYDATRDPAFLEAALATGKEAMDVLHEVRQSFYWESSKRELMASAEPLLKSSLETCLQLHEHYPQENYDWLAFNYSEQLKSIILLEATQRGQSIAEEIIPAKIREQEKDMQLRLTALINQRFQESEKGKKADQDALANLSKEIKTLKLSFDSLNLLIKEQYPGYHQRRNQISNLDTTELRRSLDPGTTLLSYVLLDSAVAVFAVNEEGLNHLLLHPASKVAAQVQQLQKTTLNGLPTDKVSNAGAADTLHQVAHQLYRELIAPLESRGWLSERLVIMPEGVLGYIPFELLLKELPTQDASPDQLAYLLQDHTISYAYSASLLLEMQELKHRPQRKAVLAFAPSFTADTTTAIASQPLAVRRNALGELFFNQQEVEKISDLVRADLYLDDQATEAKFLENAEQYSILHLATHSKANDRLGDQAFLAFTALDDDEENEILYNRDLYNLQLNADMVVLSACETGIGELQNAEGVISIARGFSYAGAKSIVSSLWAVNDATTQEIMVDYYANLAAGQPKDEALRAAKLTFIENYRGDAHPFYWAPFIVIGDTAPLQFGNQWSMAASMLVVAVLLTLILWIIKRQFS